MKKSLNKIYSRGQKSVKMRAKYAGMSHGHMLFQSCKFKGGEESHVWANIRAIGMVPELRMGMNVEFYASLKPIMKRDHTASVRLEDLREFKIVGRIG